MTPYVAYRAAAEQLDYVVPFPFLSRGHVLVRVNGVLQSLAPWPGPNTVRLLIRAPAQAFVEIERSTPFDGPLVAFQNGAVLTSEDLNTAVLQLLYKQQELVALYERRIREGEIRLGETGGITVPSDTLIDDLVAHVLQMEVVNHLLGRLGELDQNAAAILAEVNARVAALDAVRDALIDRTDGLLDALRARLDDVDTLIETIRTETVDGDAALAAQIETIAATSGANTAAIITEQTARADADSALASQITTVAAQTDENSAMIVAETVARTDADSALASQLTTVVSRVADAEAAITSFDGTSVTQDEALAESILAMTASWGIGKARFVQQIKLQADSLSSQATSITALQADYGSLSAVVLSEQTARATADEAVATRLDTVEADTATASAAIFTEQTARATADTAIAGQINAVSATVDGHTALIATESSARADADGALSTRIDAVVATAGTNTAAITSEQTARATADGALSTRIDALVAKTDTTNALVATEQTARADGDAALASSVTAVSTTVSGHTATIGTIQTSTNALQLKYGVKLNSNGFVTGFEQNNNGTSGDFTVVANVFKVVMPGTTTPILTPFTVSEGGVRIDGNLLVTGSITGAKLIDSTIDTPKITNNAVSIPLTLTRGSNMTGNDAYQTVVSGSITLTSAGTIFVSVTAGQGYSNNPPIQWNLRVLVGGTAIATVGGSGDYSDSIAVSGAIAKSAGTYSIVIEWKGGPAITLYGDSAYAIGIMK